jgi:hypothetical protein
LHFADDTLLFLEASDANIQVLRWLLISFENLSGLKINYAKCEMIPFNISEEMDHNLTSQFGCKVNYLPITYLGILLHWKSLSVQDWNFLIEKIKNKLQRWKSKLLSIGGTMILLNSIILSIPIYWMSFYTLPKTVKTRIDKLRRRFLWFDDNTIRKKIALVSWKIVCKSKQRSGLGIIDINLMNKALLVKWLIRIKNPMIIGWWKIILLYKYSTLALSPNISPFMKGIVKNKNILEVSVDWKVCNGQFMTFS